MHADNLVMRCLMARESALHLFKSPRQTIESINQTLKAQLDLERHGGHAPAGVMVRILQRILALTAAIWQTATPASPSSGR